MGVASLAGLTAALWVGALRPGPWWLALVGLIGVLSGALVARRSRRGGWLVAVVAMLLVGVGLAGGRVALAERGPLSVLAARGGVADVEAVPVTEARPTSRGAWAVVRVVAVDGAVANQRALLVLDTDDATPPIGARMTMRAAAESLGHDRFHGHLRRLGATAELIAPGGIDVVGSPGGVVAASTHVRERVRATFGQRLGDEQAALLVGLTTGDLRDRPDGQREQFAAAGLSHLVVVSGKHTALMLAGVLGLCALVGVGARGRRVVGLVALAWFVVLVRWQPSVLRAGAMAALVLVAGLLGRARVSVRMLCVAVLLLLLADPMLSGRLGFVLSVLATAGVLLFAPRLVERMRGPQWLRWTAGATIGAQVGVAPVLLGSDDGLALAALPANLVAGPAAAWGQTVGLVAGALAQLSPGLGAWVAMLAGPPLALILWAAATFAGLPTLGWSDLSTPVLVGGVVGAVLWLLRRRRASAAARVVVVVVAAGLVVGVVGVPAMRPAQPVEALSVTALDVGQGDALLVEAPDDSGATVRMLVDGGPDPSLVLQRLRERRVQALDVVVVTHGHADHASSLVDVLDALPVGALIVGGAPAGEDYAEVLLGDVVAAASDHGIPTHRVHDGDRFALGRALVTVLSPPVGGVAGAGANEQSLVLRVDGRYGSVLLTGDVEEFGQQRLLRSPDRLAVDVVQVPHHGAATNAQGFLAATGARVAVISVGVENPYGHPHPRVLAGLVGAGAEVVRTDVEGTVTVTLGPLGPVVQQRRTAGIRSSAARSPTRGGGRARRSCAR